MHDSGRLAEELAANEPNGAVWANQFDNIANRARPLSRRTGPEIWRQTGGRVDGFVCAVGTGGTLAGVGDGAQGAQAGRARSRSPIRTGRPCTTTTRTASSKAEGNSITEGIGQGRITANLEGAPIDTAYQIPDEEALPLVFDLLEHEGLCSAARPASTSPARSGSRGSSGPGHTIVTVLCDYGNRYQSKLFNPGVPAREGPAGAALARAGLTDRS